MNDEQMVREALLRGCCPDCGCGEFLEGPCGGLTINIKCAKCGSTFYHAVVDAGRIPDGGCYRKKKGPTNADE